MGPGSLLKEAWEVVPVLLLLTAGGWIALRSGVDRPTTSGNFRRFFANFYQILLRIVGYVVLLVALQYWIGLRPQLGW